MYARAPTATSTPRESLERHGGSEEEGAQAEALIPLLTRSQTGPDAVDLDDDDDEALVKKREKPDQQSRIFAAAGIAIVVLIAWSIVRLVRKPTIPPAQTSLPSLDEHLTKLLRSTSGLDLGNRFLQDKRSINVGVVPFSDAAYSPVYTAPALQHSLSTAGWSRECLELYTAQGEICSELQGRYADSGIKADVVWTWVNGSSAELLSDWMVQASQESAQKAPDPRHRHSGASIKRHFRDHDELRFSVRSVLTSIPDSFLSTLHLVVADTPATLPEGVAAAVQKRATASSSTAANASDSLHFAQVPHWVELASLQFARPPGVPPPKNAVAPFLRFHPHSTIFKLPTAAKNAVDEARAWKKKIVPSFNSLAIESQIPNIDFDSTTALYLNDDFFLTKDLAFTDLASPIYGPVFRLQRDLLVHGVAPEQTHDSPDGEWKGLGYSAWLLDERFGARGRPYLLHIAKVIPVAILKELQQIFIDDLTITATARFRGDTTEVQLLFLTTHYVLEKHREALLWSFFIARSDSDASGTYSLAERRAILDAFGHTSPTSPRGIDVPHAVRSSSAEAATRNAQLGLPNPLQTAFQFTSHDGYAYTNIHMAPDHARGDAPIWPVTADESRRAGPVCTLQLEFCFGRTFLKDSESDMSVADIFRQVAYEKPQCGDCIIALLVSKSGPKGLEAFLPPRDEQARSEPKAEGEPLAVGLSSKKWRDVVLEQPRPAFGSRRQQAAALIQRYAYSIGDTPTYFFPIRSGGDGLTNKLEEITNLDREDRPALVALNDDVNSVRPSTLEDIDVRLQRWFQETWPEPSPWEAS